MAVAGGIQAAAAVAQLIQSAKQQREANKLQRDLVNPVYRVQQPIMDNQAIAESNASQGLSDGATTAYSNQANKGLTASIDAILRGNGNINTIGDLYGNYADNADKIAMLDEEARMRNRRAMLDQNTALAGELEKKWMINEFAPAQDKKQLIANLRGTANQNKFGALNTFGSAANNYVTGNLLNTYTQPPATYDNSSRMSGAIDTLSPSSPSNDVTGAGGLYGRSTLFPNNP